MNARGFSHVDIYLGIILVAPMPSLMNSLRGVHSQAHPLKLEFYPIVSASTRETTPQIMTRLANPTRSLNQNHSVLTNNI